MIGIHWDKNQEHATKWTSAWRDYCEAEGWPWEWIDLYSSDFWARAQQFDLILWHVSQYSRRDQIYARQIIRACEAIGVDIFPSEKEIFHFDDKIIQQMIFLGASIPSPNSYFSFENDADGARSFSFPAVAKLRNGSGSTNVRMLRAYDEYTKYHKKAFSTGVDSSPSVFFKLWSNFRSSSSIVSSFRRIMRVRDFARSRVAAGGLPLERDYVYLQEFIPNEGFDLKVVVLGDKVSFIARKVRKNDFRASGGGDLFYDRDLITPEVLDLCRRTSLALGFTCMGYDLVVSKAGHPMIIEMSFGFSHHAILEAGGYFNQDNDWVSVPLDVPKELIRLLCKSSG